MQNPQFAEFIRMNWLGQSVAALLAQPSTRAAEQSMTLIEQAVETIRQVLPRQTNDEA